MIILVPEWNFRRSKGSRLATQIATMGPIVASLALQPSITVNSTWLRVGLTLSKARKSLRRRSLIKSWQLAMHCSESMKTMNRTIIRISVRQRAIVRVTTITAMTNKTFNSISPLIVTNLARADLFLTDRVRASSWPSRTANCRCSLRTLTVQLPSSNNASQTVMWSLSSQPLQVLTTRCASTTRLQ